jgi:ribonucleoside-diphosphate reductase alpha chain
MLKRLFVEVPGTAFDAVEWKHADALLRGVGGEALFELKGLEVPAWWSPAQVNICAQHYLRQNAKGAKETSFKDVFKRVAGTIADWAKKDGLLTDDTAPIFIDELLHLFATGKAAFNSPVWYNVGVYKEPQCSACFINSLDDSMESIMKLAATESVIFKGGSGAGINMSKLRGLGEPLSHGGSASGPVSFMRGFDSFAGVIKSGGRTRRAAKMIVLNVDHPDIEEFITCKAKEEQKARELIAIGYSGGMEGDAYRTVQYQNANNSVRVTDAFMRAVAEDSTFELVWRSDPTKRRKVQARTIWKKLAEAAWACGDPGIQFHDAVDRWRTVEEPITSSNPCGEFIFVDNSACNLASINLMHYKPARSSSNLEQGFKAVEFAQTVRVLIMAMDTLITHSSYPTDEITKNSRKYRPLGLGYMNLGGLLMASGIAYDSDRGRDIAAAVTSYMTACAYETSTEISEHYCVKRPEIQAEYDPTRQWEVIEHHAAAWDSYRAAASHPTVAKAWKRVLKKKGQTIRNAQVTLLAPTGTISFLTGADSTGVEPLTLLQTKKALIGGGELDLRPSCTEQGLVALGYKNIPELLGCAEAEFVLKLRAEDRPVFATAISGVNPITVDGHLKMMAAVQPGLSGAISKTVNMPNSATVDEIEWALNRAWELDLKSVTVYRDGSKACQPLAGKNQMFTIKPQRLKLGTDRPSVTHKFDIGGQEGYIHVGLHNHEVIEFFVTLAKHGGALAGFSDALATVCSIALQYGVPLDVLADKMQGSSFEPSGFVYQGHPDIKTAASIPDYIFRYLMLISGRTEVADPGVTKLSNRMCPRCGHVMRQTGTCHICTNCGDNTGSCG